MQDKNAEKQATASDLQGFWEMIYFQVEKWIWINFSFLNTVCERTYWCFSASLLTFQVEDVNAKFDSLEKLKENNWKEEEKKTKKSLKKTKAKVSFNTQVACMKV